jgi:hypothetical protein
MASSKIRNTRVEKSAAGFFMPGVRTRALQASARNPAGLGGGRFAVAQG